MLSVRALPKVCCLVKSEMWDLALKGWKTLWEKKKVIVLIFLYSHISKRLLCQLSKSLGLCGKG